MRIILDSGSDRRRELLLRLTDTFEAIASDFDEDSVEFNGDCKSFVEDLALGKAQNVGNKLSHPALIIGCDTVVFHNNKVLGKPKDEKDAFHMLRSLSGSKHEVYSGISIINTSNDQIVKDFSCTEVYFSQLSDEQIKEYIKSKEPMDKAGAYGIQGYGGIFVEKISGCYYNVVGLPINKLYFLLKGMGVNL